MKPGDIAYNRNGEHRIISEVTEDTVTLKSVNVKGFSVYNKIAREKFDLYWTVPSDIKEAIDE